jgi:hypothetical protein
MRRPTAIWDHSSVERSRVTGFSVRMRVGSGRPPIVWTASNSISQMRAPVPS